MNKLMHSKDIEVLFDILDHSSEGSVSMDEFFDGMMHIVLSHVPIQHIQMMKKLEKGQAQIEGLIEHLMDLEKTEASNEMRIMEDLRKLHEKFDALAR